MILSVLLSAAFTFTVTATGVEKGTAIEFLIAGPNTDRAYESMFVLDESVDSFCKRLEASVPRGVPVDVATCRLWPTGCRVHFEPSFDRFVKVDVPDGLSVPVSVFTGGSRHPNGRLEADDVMPAAVFSTYSLPQSVFVFNEPQDQGAVYGRYTSAVKLEKGTKITFKLTIDESSLPRRHDFTAEKGNLTTLLTTLRESSRDGDVDARVSFSDSLTVAEAVTLANALAVVDSSRVKLNGSKGLFYRAFLPLEKWRDRQERLQQPFELTLGDDGNDTLCFVEEDWNVEGNDPKLTTKLIPVEEASLHPETDTCFIYVCKTQTLSRISRAVKRLEGARIRNWYVFSEDPR